MADTTVKLRVLLESAGIKPTQKQLDNLNKKLVASATSFSNISKQANKTKRNLEGVAQRSNRAGKDFSRMSQGMGGLVQAYATVAANVFALSSAFRVLRSTADLSSMIKSAEDFSNRFGVSVTRITKRLQEATGGALSFAEALPTINKGISAGLGEEEMTQLAVAATKAAQTFGGTTTEALNRFISASQRGRVEIIQTLGIVIKTEQAYADYGARIGKTAQELSAFDRQQAIVAATIAESQNVFDKVNIDPNPFQQLVTTITDLKDEIGIFTTDFLTPFINKINQSKEAALALIAAIVASVGGRIFPAISDIVKGFTASAVIASQAARNTQLAAGKSLEEAQRKALDRQKAAVIANANEIDKIYLNSLDKRQKAHGAFTKAIINKDKEVNIAALTSRRAAIARELSARARGSGMQKAFTGITTTELKKLQIEYDKLASSIEKGNIALNKMAVANKQMSAQATIGAKRIVVGFAQVRSAIAATTSQMRTGFAQVFAATQTSLVKAFVLTGRAWKILVRDIQKDSVLLRKQFLNLGRVAGRSLGLVAGALSKVVSGLFSLTIAVSIGKFIWETYGDRIRGISKELRNVLEAQEDFEKELIDISGRLSEAISVISENLPNTLKRVGDSLRFISGSFTSVSSAVKRLRSDIIENLGNRTISEAQASIKALEAQAASLRKESFSGRGVGLSAGLDQIIFGFTEAGEKAEELTDKAEKLQQVLNSITLPNIAGQLIQSLNLAEAFSERAGFSTFADKFQEELVNTLQSSDLLPQVVKDRLGKIDFKDILSADSIEEARTLFINELEKSDKNFSPESMQIVSDLFLVATQNATGFFGTIAAQGASAERTIQELNNRINTFVLGLDKKSIATGPNKEFAGFAIDAQNVINTFSELQDEAENANLSKAFANKEELQLVKALLGFRKDEVVKINEAKAAAAETVSIYKEEARVRTVGAAQVKKAETFLKNIKDRVIKSDQDARVQAFAEESALAAIASAKADIIFGEVQAQREKLNTLKIIGNLSEEDLLTEKLKLAALEDQLEIYNEETNRHLQFIQSKLKVLNLDIEIIKTLKQQLDIGQQILQIDAQLVSNLSDYLEIQEDIFFAKTESIKKDLDLIEAERLKLKIGKIRGPQLDRELRSLRLQELSLERQLQLLNRQQEARLAQQIEQAGTTVFSEDGLRASAHFFRRAMEEEIPKLKSTFEILGRGFAKTVLDTFDTMVDNLLEGGRDFVETVREGLKASLRDVIGEAIKTNIRKGLIELVKNTPLFDSLFSNESKAEAEAAETKTFRDHNIRLATEAIQKADRQIEIQEQIAINTGQASVSTKVPGLATMFSAAGQGGINPETIGGAGAVLSEETLKKGFRDLLGINKKQAKIAQNPPPIDLTKPTKSDLNEAPNTVSALGILGSVVSAASGDSKTAIVQALFAIAAQIIASQQASSATGFLGLFGKGGMMQGRNSPITPMASGGLVRQPSLALIGEGKNTEAVVPLPNNREIPVEMKGGGDTVEVNFNQSFDFSGATPDTVNQLRHEARMIEERTFNRVFTEINKGGRYAKMVGRR